MADSRKQEGFGEHSERGGEKSKVVAEELILNI